ncbi:hypothetical protein B0H13DRAFT_1855608 [Mycena leptocephala]|nr:hypothetical protein B0H13DRAFT_1855608 [Mycena leptocephala]
MPRNLSITNKNPVDPLMKALDCVSAKKLHHLFQGNENKLECITTAIKSLGTPPNREHLEKILREATNGKLEAYLKPRGFPALSRWKKDALVATIIVECLGPCEDEDGEDDEPRPERKTAKQKGKRKAKSDSEHADELAKGKSRNDGSHEPSERKGQKSEKLPLFRDDEAILLHGQEVVDSYTYRLHTLVIPEQWKFLRLLTLPLGRLVTAVISAFSFGELVCMLTVAFCLSLALLFRSLPLRPSAGKPRGLRRTKARKNFVLRSFNRALTVPLFSLILHETINRVPV